MRHHGEYLIKLLSGKEWKWFIKYTHNVAATYTICWLFLQLIPVFPQMCIQFTSYIHIVHAVRYLIANIGL
mgnify:CR=1 FL=1